MSFDRIGFFAVIPIAFEIETVGMDSGSSSGVLGGDLDRCAAKAAGKDMHQKVKARMTPTFMTSSAQVVRPPALRASLASWGKALAAAGVPARSMVAL